MLAAGALIDDGVLALDDRLVDVVSVPLPGISPEVTDDRSPARAAFIFVSQGGKISAWSPAVNMTNAIQVAADTAAVYTGAALGGTPTNPRLDAADFKGGTVDI